MIQDKARLLSKESKNVLIFLSSAKDKDFEKMIGTHKLAKTFDNYSKGTTLAVVESYRGTYSVRGYKFKELYLATTRGVLRVFSTEKEAREYLDVHVVGKRGVIRRIPCLVLDR